MSVVENFWIWVEKISTTSSLRLTVLSLWILVAMIVVNCALTFCEEKESLVGYAKKEKLRREIAKRKYK